LKSSAAEGKSRHKVPVALRETAIGFSTPQLLDSWTAVSTEQNENVYEDKGQLVRFILLYRARVNTSCNSSRVRLMGLPLVLLAREASSTRVVTSFSSMP